MSNLDLNPNKIISDKYKTDISKSAPQNLNNNQSINIDEINSFKKLDSVVTTIKNDSSSNIFSKKQNINILSKISSENILKPEDLIIETKKNINNKSNVQSKNIIKPVEIKEIPEFDPETTTIVNKFIKSNLPPYSKGYACNLAQGVVTGTSLIEDSECTPMYDKVPQELVKDIFKNEKIKSDPELKIKIKNLISLLSVNDKNALISINNLVDRKPPISKEITYQIIDKISSMIGQKYDSRIGNEKDFAISLLHDVSMPFDISQEGIGTCTATSIQIQFAIRSPLEYLKMAEELAQNKEYTTVKGYKVIPNFTFVDELSKNNDSRRTISSKLMQNSIMDYGDGDTRNFDSSKKDEGLTITQTAKAIKDILGLDVENNFLWENTPSQIIDYLKRSNPSLTNPIEISLAYSPSGRDVLHSVNVIGIDENNVKIANPWGREETFPLKELQSRILSVTNNKFNDIEIQNIKDTSVINSLFNEDKNNTLANLKTNQKVDIIQDIFSKWDGYKGKYVITPELNPQEKKIILNILEDLLQGSDTQNKIWYPRIKHFCPDINILLDKINNNTEQFSKVKEKLVAASL